MLSSSACVLTGGIPVCWVLPLVRAFVPIRSSPPSDDIAIREDTDHGWNGIAIREDTDRGWNGSTS
jgi:hypothetical protein